MISSMHNARVWQGSNWTSIADCVCKENFFVDMLASVLKPGDAHYPNPRFPDHKFKTWECIACPDNAICNGTTDGKGEKGVKPWYPAPPYAAPEAWSFERPEFRTEMFECDGEWCLGGSGYFSDNGTWVDNLEGVAQCDSTTMGFACGKCSDDHFMSFGSCRKCQWILWNVLFILAIWFGWYYHVDCCIGMCC